MRTSQIITHTIFLICGVTISVLKPDFIAGNQFLIDFVNHEYINVLSVIVTVSLVSVTQIHLEYTRLERRFKKRVFTAARQAVNISALVLVGMLVLAFPLSFIKAEFEAGSTGLGIIFVLALMTILEAIFTMYDLVKTSGAIAANEPIEKPNDNVKSGS